MFKLLFRKLSKVWKCFYNSFRLKTCLRTTLIWQRRLNLRKALWRFSRRCIKNNQVGETLLAPPLFLTRSKCLSNSKPSTFWPNHRRTLISTSTLKSADLSQRCLWKVRTWHSGGTTGGCETARKSLKWTTWSDNYSNSNREWTTQWSKRSKKRRWRPSKRVNILCPF